MPHPRPPCFPRRGFRFSPFLLSGPSSLPPLFALFSFSLSLALLFSMLMLDSVHELRGNDFLTQVLALQRRLRLLAAAYPSPAPFPLHGISAFASCRFPLLQRSQLLTPLRCHADLHSDAARPWFGLRRRSQVWRRAWRETSILFNLIEIMASTILFAHSLHSNFHLPPVACK